MDRHHAIRIAGALTAIAALAAAGTAASYRTRYQAAREEAANERLDTRIVAQFLSLTPVALPSELSPYWLVRSTQRFEDAPIQIVEFGDPVCSDCRILLRQMKLLEKEFAGKMNVAYQFFPLEAKCNNVVEKDKHPGACDLAYMMAARPDSFVALHDEILENMDSAKTAAWRARFAARYGLEGALADTALHARVQRLIRTGMEYEKTSEKYRYGIRSTPTLIVNGRMIIGTLPLEQLRAILQALVAASELEKRGFIESWINPGCGVDVESGQCGPS